MYTIYSGNRKLNVLERLFITFTCKVKSKSNQTGLHFMNYELLSNLIWPESEGHHYEKCISKWRVVDWWNLMAFFQTWICNLKSICIFKWYWLWQCIYWASDPKDYFIYPANNVKIFPSIFGSFWTKKLDRKKSEIIWLYFDFVIENVE